MIIASEGGAHHIPTMSNETICDICSALQECKNVMFSDISAVSSWPADPDISVIATALKLTSWSIAFFEFCFGPMSRESVKDESGR